MNSILDKIFFDNSVREYLITASIIVIVILLKRILSKLMARIISRMVVSKNRPFDKQRFHQLVLSPIELFVVVLAVIIAFYRLKFPTLLNIDIYRASLHAVMEAVARGVLIGSFIWLCNRLVTYVAGVLHQRAKLTQDRSDDQLIVFFRDFLKVIIWIIGVLLILKFSFGFEMSNVFTGLSIVGAALALAFRESLENLIASFIIFFDKPFIIGDLVKVQTVTGTVEKIGLRSTRIRTTDKTFVTVPNKQMVDSILDNQSMRTQRKVLTYLEISLDVSASQLSELVTAIEQMLQQEIIIDHNVYVSNTGSKAHIIHVEYFADSSQPNKDFLKLRQAVNVGLIQLLSDKGIGLAAEQPNEVVIKNETQ